MAKNYKSSKRMKELARKKKQEEKRLKRLNRRTDEPGEGEALESEANPVDETGNSLEA